MPIFPSDIRIVTIFNGRNKRKGGIPPGFPGLDAAPNKRSIPYADAIASPRMVPVDVANRSDSMPNRCRTLTNRFGNG